jgi:hypothetical protein
MALAWAACGPGSNDSDAIFDARQGDAGIDAANRPYEGLILFANRQLPSGSESRATAGFHQGPVFVETGVSGTCHSYEPTPNPPLSMGDIAVEGGTAPFTLRYSAGGYAPTAALPEPLFGQGDMITLFAPGDDLAMFGGFARGVPMLAGVTLPPSVSRSDPATFTWTEGTTNEIWIWLTGPSGSLADGFLFCRTVDFGDYVIPAEAMAFLPAGFAQTTPSLLRVDDVRVTSADATVHVVAASEVVGAPIPVQ